MSDAKPEDALRELTRDAWARYLDLLDGFRPDLFRYCRSLAGNVWDAEDLVQDTLEQGFARLGTLQGGIDNPRGYVLRIASNLWLSRLRRARVALQSTREGKHLAPAQPPSPDSAAEMRDASAALLQYLAPQERAAVVLKETFDLTLAEIADALGTSVGAVKAALHRGRERLRQVDDALPPRHPVSKAVVDRFVERYNARDLPGLLALMLDSAEIDMLGAEQFVGRENYARKPGWFHYNFYRFDGKPSDATWETVLFHGEPVVLVLAPRNGALHVTSVMRLETDDEHVARIRVYAMCPDTVREVAKELGRPAGTMGLYRLPRELLARIAAAARKA